MSQEPEQPSNDKVPADGTTIGGDFTARLPTANLPKDAREEASRSEKGTGWRFILGVLLIPILGTVLASRCSLHSIKAARST